MFVDDRIHPTSRKRVMPGTTVANEQRVGISWSPASRGVLREGRCAGLLSVEHGRDDCPPGLDDISCPTALS
jgi:hypothetical protein